MRAALKTHSADMCDDGCQALGSLRWRLRQSLGMAAARSHTWRAVGVRQVVRISVSGLRSLFCQ